MQYQGGKQKIARVLADAMLAYRRPGDTHYLEPFMGGGAVFATMAPHFLDATGSDAAVDLIAMWDAAAHHGWLPPEVVTRERYDELRRADDPADPATAFAAYGCSFGGKRWGGYASNSIGRNYAGAAQRAVTRKAAAMTGATLVAGSYAQHVPDERTLVYSDPPYVGTTGYAGTDPWDAEAFWGTMNRWADLGALVFVSEYAAPDGWTAVWSRQKRMTLEKSDNRRMATENLFMRA